MALTSRKHLGRQEEAVEESGVQLRTDDPVSPVLNQTWINTSQKKMKTRTVDGTLILADGGIGDAIEIPPSDILDFSASRHYFKTLGTDPTYEILDVQNLAEGVLCFVRFNNPNPNVAQVFEANIPNLVDIEDGHYWLVDAVAEKYYVFYDLEGLGNNDPMVADRVAIPVTFSKGLAELTQYTAPAGNDVTSGQYFEHYSANNSTEYAFVYNVDGLGGIPSLPGKTIVQIPILSTDTQSEVAQKSANVIDGLADFNAVNVGNNFNVENDAVGVATDATNVNVGGTFAVNILTQGKAPDTNLAVAIATALALDNNADFSCPEPTTQVITVTNTDDGFVEEPANGNMGGSFALNVIASGSGRIFVEVPTSFIIESGQDTFVEANSEKLLTILHSGSVILVGVDEYAI